MNNKIYISFIDIFILIINNIEAPHSPRSLGASVDTLRLRLRLRKVDKVDKVDKVYKGNFVGRLQ